MRYCSLEKSYTGKKRSASTIPSMVSYCLGAALEKCDLNESSTANPKRQELDTINQMCSLQRRELYAIMATTVHPFCPTSTSCTFEEYPSKWLPWASLP